MCSYGRQLQRFLFHLIFGGVLFLDHIYMILKINLDEDTIDAHDGACVSVAFVDFVHVAEKYREIL